MSPLRFLLLTIIFGSVTTIIGCGDGHAPSRSVEPPPPSAKATLQEIAASGNLSAKKVQLKEELEGMGESEPEKAEELLADYEQLTSLSGAAKIKAKAKEMADKL